MITLKGSVYNHTIHIFNVDDKDILCHLQTGVGLSDSSTRMRA